ncbi:MAG: zinc-dependent metalloprotease family protein [Candidatus Hodarchaeales archaeon]
MKTFFLQITIFIISLSSIFNVGILEEPSAELILDNNVQSYNTYRPDGNISILVALDSSLLGEDKYFINYSIAKKYFELWLRPLEVKLNIKFHVNNVTKYLPENDDSLFSSMTKVTNSLDWKLASSIDDVNNNGNGYDILVIYQKNYNGGRNHANALFSNALIIAHNQPLNWVSHQLILLHEICHLFGAAHDENGVVPSEWYGSAQLSIMSYSDLTFMTYKGFDKNNLQIDDRRNYQIINNSKYRFDNVDPDSDGLPNWYEYSMGFNPNLNDSSLDLDKDGLTNLQEFTIGTNPNSSDTDFDGYSDWFEYNLGSDPLNSSSNLMDQDPIILQFNNVTTLSEGENLTLQWLAASYSPDRYVIFRNGSLVFEDEWDEELIEYDVESVGGIWNYTCVVYNSDGKHSSSSIIINIIQHHKSGYDPSILFITILTIISIKMRRTKS